MSNRFYKKKIDTLSDANFSSIYYLFTFYFVSKQKYGRVPINK